MSTNICRTLGVVCLALSGCVGQIGPDDSDSLAVDDGAEPQADPKFHRADDPIAGSYIAFLSEEIMRSEGVTPEQLSDRVALDYDVVTGWTGDHIHCVMFTGTEEEAQKLAKDPRISSVTEDATHYVGAVQPNAIPGLDIIDGARDNSYEFNATGAGVTVFVLDTGIRTTHDEFEGRAVLGQNFVPDGRDASDCDGHGTHVASTIGRSQFGVAKDVRLVSMRVLGCNGSGSTSGIIRAINGSVAQASQQNLQAVINMSLGGGRSNALDQAVNTAMNRNVFVAVAAGNENEDACTGSPARSNAMTVCATTFDNRRAGFSNFGSCVDMCAPGQSIRAAGVNNDELSVLKSGTSMASPHVAGAAALLMSVAPQLGANDVKTALINASRTGIAGLRGSPDRLLFTGFIDAGDGGDGGDGDGGDGGGEEPSVGTPRSGSATGTVVRGRETRFQPLPVVPGTPVRIELSGDGDADLYVRLNDRPTVTRFNCRPFRQGSSELCEGTIPAGTTTINIMVRGFAAQSSFRIDATWVEP